MIEPTKDFIVLELPYVRKPLIVKPDNIDPMNTISDLVVCKLGPDVKNVKLGDSLIVAPEAILPCTVNKKKYFLTREENVCAIIRS